MWSRFLSIFKKIVSVDLITKMLLCRSENFKLTPGLIQQCCSALIRDLGISVSFLYVPFTSWFSFYFFVITVRLELINKCLKTGIIYNYICICPLQYTLGYCYQNYITVFRTITVPFLLLPFK